MGSLSKKMILGAGLVILALLGAGFTLGIYSLQTMREVVTDQFNKQQLVLAEQAAGQIEGQLKIVIQELSILNQSPAVQQLEAGRWSNRIKITQAVIRKLGVIEIGRVDASGKTVYSVDLNDQVRISPPGPGHPKEVHSWAGLPENQGKIKVIKERLSEGPLPGRPLLMLALPAYRDTVNKPHADRGFAGYLYGLVDRELLVTRVVKGLRSGASGYGWAIDDQGNFIYHPLPEFVGRNAFTVREQQGVPVSFDQINAIQRDKMLRGEQGMAWYFSGWHRGLKGKIKKLIAYAPVRLELSPAALNWSVAVVAPITEVDEAIQMVYTRQLLMEGFILLAILLGGFLLLSFQWSQTRVLKGKVEEKTRDWLQSEKRYSKLVESAQDLIFTVDQEGRILSLNRYGVEFLEGRLLAMDLSEVQFPGFREASGDRFLDHSLFEYLGPPGFFPSGSDPRDLGKRKTQGAGTPGSDRVSGMLAEYSASGHQRRKGSDPGRSGDFPRYYHSKENGSPNDENGKTGLPGPAVGQHCPRDQQPAGHHPGLLRLPVGKNTPRRGDPSDAAKD